jgi:hypothetical protein
MRSGNFSAKFVGNSANDMNLKMASYGTILIEILQILDVGLSPGFNSSGIGKSPIPEPGIVLCESHCVAGMVSDGSIISDEC